MVETVARDAAVGYAEAEALRDADRRQPVLPGGVRPAGGRAAATWPACWPRTEPPTAVHDVLVRRLGPAARADPGGAAGRRGDRPAVRPGHPGRGRAASTEDALLDLLEPAQPAGLVREDGVDRVHASPTPWSATRSTPGCRRPAGPGCTPGSPRRWPSGRRGRPSRPGTGSPPARRTPPRPGRRRSPPPRVARRLHAHERVRRAARRGARRAWPTTRAPGRASATTC